MISKWIYIAILSFAKSLDAQKVKYISLNNEPCLARKGTF